MDFLYCTFRKVAAAGGFFISFGAFASAPTITSTANPDTQINQTYSYQVEASDPEGDDLTYELVSHPVGMSIDSSGLLIWNTTTDDAGEHQYIVRVKDEELNNVDQSVILRVEDPLNTAPAFSGTPVTETFINSLYEFDAQASDPEGDEVVYTVSSWPVVEGLTIDSNGRVSWTPDIDDVGQYVIRIFADDQRLGRAELSYHLKVFDPENSAPVIQNAPEDTEININELYTYQLLASDADGEAIDYTLYDWPAGTGITVSDTGQIQWTPNESQVGDYTVTIIVDDGRLGESRYYYVIKVRDPNNLPPEINGEPTTAVNFGEQYIFDLQAVDPEGESLTYQLIVGSEIPSGLSLNDQGILSWVPSQNQVGRHGITIVAKDPHHAKVILNYELRVEDPTNTPPVITNKSVNVSIDVGYPYIHDLQAQDPDGDPLTYGLYTEPENSGVSISDEGVLQWVPTAEEEGRHKIIVHVNDNRLGKDSHIYYIDIVNDGSLPPSNTAPVANDLAVDTNEDTDVSVVLTGSDNEGDSLTYFIDTQPNNGVLAGEAPNLIYTPNGNFFGSDSFSYHVNDGELDSATVLVSIDISSVNDTPRILSNPPLDVDEGVQYQYQIVADDVENETLEYELLESPAGMLVDTQNGFVTWDVNFDSQGVHSVLIAVRDGVGESIQSFQLTVQNVNRAPVFDSVANQATSTYFIFWYLLTAEDLDGEMLTFDLSNGPDGLEIDEESGLIQWMPLYDDIGEHLITATVTDEGGRLDQVSFVVNVEPIEQMPPEFVSTPIETGGAGGTYRYEARAESEAGSYITYSLSRAPAGMTISHMVGDVNWDLSNVDPAIYGVTVVATDSNSNSASQSYSLDVTGNTKPIIVSSEIKTVPENSSYAYQVVADDEDGDLLTYELVSGPADMEIDPVSGLLTWLPSGNSTPLNIRKTSCFAQRANADFVRPVVKWKYDAAEASNSVVGPMEDTNNDGVIDTNDDISIALLSRIGNDIFLTKLDADGNVLWMNDQVLMNRPMISYANLDGGSSSEILVVGRNNLLHAFDSVDGSVKWTAPASGGPVVDVDADGDLEIISAGGALLDHEGNILWSVGISGRPVPVDVNLDGIMEIIFGRTLYDADGNFIRGYGGTTSSPMAVPIGLDEDPYPEFIVHQSNRIAAYDTDGSFLWDVLPGTIGNSDLVVANMDDDIYPEIAVNGVVISHDGEIQSRRSFNDSSNFTHPTAFDFLGTGKYQVIVNDEPSVYFNFGSGVPLYRYNNVGSFTQGEEPIVVDIDRDGHAEILIFQNDGLTLLEDQEDLWPGTRSFWKQHSFYHEMFDDEGNYISGHIKEWNYDATYRVNLATESEGIPDLQVVSADPVFGDDNIIINFDIVNNGLGKASRETYVNIYDADREEGGALLASIPVYGLESGEQRSYSAILPGNDFDEFYLEIDPDNQVQECYEGNNHNTVDLVRIRVSDPLGATDEQSFGLGLIRENSIPEIDTIGEISVQRGRYFEYQIVVNDSDVGDQIEYSLDQAPGYVELTQDGKLRIFFRATSSDETVTYPVTVSVTDGSGAVDSETFGLVSLPPTSDLPPFIVNPIPGDEITVNADELFEYKFEFEDPEGSKVLPVLILTHPGAEFDQESGIFRWRPTSSFAGVPRDYFEIRYHDLTGKDDVYRFAVDVVDPTPNQSPEIVNGGRLVTALTGELFEYQFLATDTDGYIERYAISNGNTPTPSEVTVDETRGLVSWIPGPENIGQNQISIRVFDNEGRNEFGYISVNVVDQPSNRLPVVDLPAPDLRWEVDELYQHQMNVTDPDGDDIEFSFVRAPSGMTIDENGLISWTPGSTGLHRTVLNISDGAGGYWYIFEVRVVNSINVLPEILSSPVLESVVGFNYQYNPIVLDENGDSPLSYSFSSSPDGMVIDETTGQISWVPNSEDVGTRYVDFGVSDGQTPDASHQFYDLHVYSLESAIPKISSSPKLTTIAEQSYQYTVGSISSVSATREYTLDCGPAGMNIDGATGQITWLPSVSDIGDTDVCVTVTNLYGAATQNFKLVVSDRNDAPVYRDGIVTEAYVNQPYNAFINIEDPEGQTLNFQLLNPPTGVTVSPAGVISWAPVLAQVGEHTIELRIDDGENYLDLGYVLNVSRELPDLEIIGGLDPVVAEEGEEVNVAISSVGAVGVPRYEVEIESQTYSVIGNNFSFPAGAPGNYDVVVRVTDAELRTSSINLNLNVRDPNDTVPPVVALHSPLVGEIVTSPVDIVVSVDDENLTRYQVLLESVSGGEPQILYTGTENLTEGVVTQLDPSMLLNGQYRLGIVANDVGGNTSSIAHPLTIEGDLKVGNFSFTVRDLTIPLAGIPIEVNRTYDSRRRNENLDFGYGWSVDYQNMLIEESRAPGVGWIVNDYPGRHILIDYCVEPLGGAPLVSITLPSGDVEKFEVAASPHCMESVSEFDVSLVFNPVGNTQSTLSALNTSGLRVQGDHLEILGDGFAIDPNRYILTTREGYTYYLNQDFGIESVEDPNGHTLTYTDAGIFHSSGKAITFERDTDGLITDVIAPNGARLVYVRDLQGDLTSVTDRDGAETEYTYNLNHGLVDIIDPLDRRITRNLYNEEGRLVGQEDGYGNVKTFDHDLDTRSSLITDLDDRSTLVIYDERGNITEERILITDGSYDSDISTTYTYDANDNQETRAIGERVWTNIHSENNDVVESRNPMGDRILYGDYDSRGQEGTLTDESGNTYTMEYDSAGNLISVESPEIIDPDSGEVLVPEASQVINRHGLIESTTDLRGLTTHYTYYPEGHVNEYQLHTESNSLGGTVTYTYDENNNVVTETRDRTTGGSILNETTTYEYDKRDRLIVTIYHDGSYTETEFDLLGNISRDRDRFGSWTSYNYDLYGRLIETVYADGTTEARTYTLEGLLDAVTDRAGRATRNEYDSAGRLWRIHNEGDSTYTEIRYNDIGWVIAEYDASRNVTEFEYDSVGRRVAVVRYEEDSTILRNTVSYYPNGEQQSETDALGHTTTYILNELDQRIEVQYHNGTSTRDRFDFTGTRTHSIDQEGRSTVFTYDGLGRLTSVAPEVIVEGLPVPATTYAYDEKGNKLTQTDAEGRTTSWTYDLFGRVLSRQLPEGMVETFIYSDGQGCLPSEGINCSMTANPRTTIHTDFNGDTTTTAYDIMGRMISVQYSKDDNSEVYSYYSDDQVRTVTDQHGTTTYTYDSRGRLESEAKPNGSILSYTYDANGNRTSVSITRGGVVTSNTSYSYDALNRIEDVTDDSGATTYTYDSVGNLDTVTYPNGLQADYNYNSVNQLTELYVRDPINTVISHFNYVLTPTGRREMITELDGRSSSYTYDELYRLIDENIIDSVNDNYSATYEYDFVGNRRYKTVNGVQTAYNYDLNDRVVQAGSITYGYDDNGNMLTESLGEDTKVYTWDGKNKLISMDDGIAFTYFTYNYRGVRTSKIEDDVITQFIVDENTNYAQVLEEVEGGTSLVKYSYGHDLLNQERAGVFSYYHYDGLGSTRALSDDSADITDTYDYSAFGDSLNQTGNTLNSYLFTGEQFDNTLNQYYLRARYYDQNVGRFTQMDSWAGFNSQPITLNKYLYANADPVIHVDPSGNASLIEQTTASNISSRLVVATIRVGVKHIARGLRGAAVRSIRALSAEIRRCRASQGRRCRLPDTVVVGVDYPASRKHIFDAIAGRGSNGAAISPLVTYSRGANRRRGWMRTLRHTRGECIGDNRQAGEDCDEWPFATTKEGGKQGYARNRVSLRPIPAWDNQGSGRLWGRAVGRRGISTGSKIVIAPVGGLSFYFINGQFGL